MTRPAIEKQIRKDYPDMIKSGAKLDWISVHDVSVIVSNFLESKRMNPTEHWKPVVDTFFKFYESKYGFAPDFTGENTKHLKEIMVKLKKLAIENNKEWTEKNATGYLTKLLSIAYADDWLKQNFLLKSINNQYSKLRANERAKKDNRSDKVGRLSADTAKEYFNRRKAKPDTQGDTLG
jgi:hypothetical protein